MAKRRFAKAARAADAPLKTAGAPAISKGTQPTLHRGRKKRLQTRQRAEHKKQFIRAELQRIELERVARQHRAQGALLKGLGDLSSAVLELDGEEARDGRDGRSGSTGGEGKGRLSWKQRCRIVEVEKEQVRRVQTHEAYVNNPMEALRQHLNNTVCGGGAEIPRGDTIVAKKSKSKANGGDDKAQGASAKAMAKPVTASQDALRKGREEEGRKRVESKRQYKQALSEMARRRANRQQAAGMKKQSASSVLCRGGIGVKRSKLT